MTTYPPTVFYSSTGAQHTYAYVQYDGLGRKKYETEQTSSLSANPPEIPSGAIKKEFDYDIAGRLKAVVLPSVQDPEAGDAWKNPEYHYVYDAFGNMFGQIDAKKRITIFKYNELHQQTHKYQSFVVATIPTTAAEVYALNLTGKLFEFREYDTYGRLEWVTDYIGQKTKYEYDSQGRLEYNKYYEVGQSTPAETFEYGYDKIGRRETITLGSDEYRYVYDADGRIKYLTSPSSQDVVGYSYSPKTGRQVATFITDAVGSENISNSVNYTYDSLGRLHSATRDTISATYGYNAVGSLQNVTYGSGLSATYAFDALNRLDTLTWSNGTSYDYDCYANGMRWKVTENDGTTYTWSYDNLNRLKQEVYDTSGTTNDYTHIYTYDLVGNRKKFTNNGTDKYYFYYANSLDQLEKETSDSAGNNVLVSYNYDNNGSLTSKTASGSPPVTTTYQYNLQNRLKSVNNGSLYKYNPDGIRIVSGSTTYLIDPYNHTGYAQVYKEITGSTSTVYTIASDVIAQTIGSSTQYFVYDGHGSVRQLTNADGSTAESYHYDAYGNLQGSPANPATSLLYAGEMRDNTLSWYNNRDRWFIPTLGIFNQPDRFGGYTEDPPSLHKYLYCHGNPINLHDPTGYMSISELSVNMATRVIVFAVQHPRLVAAIGVAIDIFMPQEFQEAMIGSGIAPFQFAGEMGLTGKGAARSIFALKNPTFKKIIDRWSKSASGKMSREIGLVFENYFKKLMPGAVRNVKLGGTNNSVDFDWQGYFIEIKSGISSFDFDQLKAFASAAKRNGKTLIYYFLEEP